MKCQRTDILPRSKTRRTVTHDYTTHLILWHRAVHHKREAQQDPWKIWCPKDQQPQEAKHSVWVLSAPDIDQGT